MTTTTTTASEMMTPSESTPRRPLLSERTRTVCGSLLVLVAFLVAWQWGPGWLGMPEYILPNLSHVLRESVVMWTSNDLLKHFGITALEVVFGFLFGALLGLAVGVALGLSPRAEAMLSPYILALQIAPKVAFAPLFVMWLGYTIYPKIIVAVLIVFFPIMINVLSAIRTVDPHLDQPVCHMLDLPVEKALDAARELLKDTAADMKRRRHG